MFWGFESEPGQESSPLQDLTSAQILPDFPAIVSGVKSGISCHKFRKDLKSSSTEALHDVELPPEELNWAVSRHSAMGMGDSWNQGKTGKIGWLSRIQLIVNWWFWGVWCFCIPGDSPYERGTAKNLESTNLPLAVGYEWWLFFWIADLVDWNHLQQSSFERTMRNDVWR